MAQEKLPKIIIVVIVAGIAAFVATPKLAGLDYETKKPAVDVSKIGIESQISSNPMGKEGSPEHEALHRKVEASVFKSPAGQYTAEDIRLNGPLSPAEKFGNLMSNHDMNPKKGDPVCPITMTKANPDFYWYVGGKKYLFCCPPCIEEFVMRAKKSNTPLPGPEKYVQS
jgi:YHS domain-containing protein